MIDEDPGPVVQRLILGEKLRALREASGIGLDDANARLKWYRGKLSKVETGMLGLTEKDLRTLLKIYQVDGPEAADVDRLRLESKRRAAPERVADRAKQYVPLERAASEIRMVYAEIPAIFQTKGHAIARLQQSPTTRAAEVEAMAAARQRRGDRLFGERAPKVGAVLGEEALARRIGEPHVRRAQLERLRELSELTHVTLRVVPFDQGMPVALSTGYTLLWIEPANATIVYVETLTSADYVKTSMPYKLAFEYAERDALSEQETQALLDHYLTNTS